MYSWHSATQIISPVGGEDPLCTVSLGHFAEGAGEHYVSLLDLSDSSQEHIQSQHNGQEEHL